ncbi:MAG: putative ABC transport system permease protein [Gammaproteobacteria bacterium]|jgi:putative ABC transport system permease protein
MQAKGEILVINLDDTIYIPLARGLDMFNRDGLVEIDLEYRPGYDEKKSSMLFAIS